MRKKKGRVEIRPAHGQSGHFVIEVNGVELGYVNRHKHWRRFVFSPLNDTLFDGKCLRQIADFCDELSRAAEP